MPYGAYGYCALVGVVDDGLAAFQKLLSSVMPSSKFDASQENHADGYIRWVSLWDILDALDTLWLLRVRRCR